MDRSMGEESMQFKVTMGVCWAHHEWNELGPYMVKADNEEDAEIAAAEIADREIEEDAPSMFDCVHLFLVHIEEVTDAADVVLPPLTGEIDRMYIFEENDDSSAG